MYEKTNSIPVKEEEYQIYARQLSLSSIQLQGQERLKNATVLCVGAGGLGAIVLLYLAAAGVGIIGIIDDDTVALSNLHRQVIYTSNDIGEYKVASAYQHLSALNQHVKVNTYRQKLTLQNGYSILKKYEIVIDCTDSFKARDILSHMCKRLHKVHIYAAIASFTGQASVFNYMGGPSYHEVYGTNLTRVYPSCTTNGVLGILPGMMGMIQATETIKIITGIGNVLNGYLLKYDALAMYTQKTRIRQSVSKGSNESQLITHLETYSSHITNIITFVKISKMFQNKIPTYLIDLRNADDYKIAHLSGSVNIPLSLVREEKILGLLKVKSRESNIVVYCSSSIKSNIASSILDNAQIVHLSLKIP